jgi:hypothetical protein
MKLGPESLFAKGKTQQVRKRSKSSPKIFPPPITYEAQREIDPQKRLKHPVARVLQPTYQTTN